MVARRVPVASGAALARAAEAPQGQVEVAEAEAAAVVVDSQDQERTMKTYYKSHRHALVALIVLLATAMLYLCANAQAENQGSVPSSPAAGQKTFATPHEAVKALLNAASTDDVAGLLSIFGPSGEDLFSSADPVRDQSSLKAFVAKAQVKQVVALDPKDASRAILSVGSDLWPLPVPIVKQKGREE